MYTDFDRGTSSPVFFPNDPLAFSFRTSTLATGSAHPSANQIPCTLSGKPLLAFPVSFKGQSETKADKTLSTFENMHSSWWHWNPRQCHLTVIHLRLDLALGKHVELESVEAWRQGNEGVRGKCVIHSGVENLSSSNLENLAQIEACGVCCDPRKLIINLSCTAVNGRFG
jgi:hypothetical protein